jgi:ABC-type transporter Mla MlaB component
MEIHLAGSTGQLQGNLTEAGVTGNSIDSLSDSLQQIGTDGGAKHVSIDCAKVLGADLGGVRLLYTWIQCARIVGIELELVNLSDSLRQVMQKFGLRDCFTN